MTGRTLYFATALLIACAPGLASAQDSRVYAGAALTGVTQPHSEDEPLGGTTAGSSVTAGVWISPRVAIESEVSFGSRLSWDYRYNPSFSTTVDVTASRRDTIVGFQARFAGRHVEPVAGGAYVHKAIARRATYTFNGATYFEDARTDHRFAIVGGLDAPIPAGRHFAIVPTFRVFFVADNIGYDAASFTDPLGEQTGTGPFRFRYGVGARVTF